MLLLPHQNATTRNNWRIQMKSQNLELLNIDANGVAWVEADTGEVIGIVSAFKIIDQEGLVYPDCSAVDILEQHCEVNQNHETEANEIEFIAENGESSTLSISAYSVELIENN